MENNANQIRFKIDTLRISTRTSAIDHIQDFIQLKDKLDELN